MGINVREGRSEIVRRLMQELEQVPPEVLPPDDRECVAIIWEREALRKGYGTIEEILGDRRIKARLLDGFDNVAADERLKSARAMFDTRKRPLSGMKPSQTKLGRNEICLCGSGKKYKKCCFKQTM